MIRQRLLTLLVGLLFGALIAGPMLAQAQEAGPSEDVGPGEEAAEGEEGDEEEGDEEERDEGRGGSTETDRLFGADRFETSVAISQYEYRGGASEVYLARADNFADAVSAGALKKGPILLVPTCGELPEVVAEEIARLHPRKVVALGGEAAICDDILDAAAEAARANRGGGDDGPLEEDDTTGSGENDPLEEDDTTGSGENDPLEEDDTTGSGENDPLEEDDTTGSGENS